MLGSVDNLLGRLPALPGDDFLAEGLHLVRHVQLVAAQSLAVDVEADEIAHSFVPTDGEKRKLLRQQPDAQNSRVESASTLLVQRRTMLFLSRVVFISKVRCTDSKAQTAKTVT